MTQYDKIEILLHAAAHGLKPMAEAMDCSWLIVLVPRDENPVAISASDLDEEGRAMLLRALSDSADGKMNLTAPGCQA